MEYLPPYDIESYTMIFPFQGFGPYEIPLIMPPVPSQAKIFIQKDGYKVSNELIIHDGYYWNSVDPEQPGGPPQYLIEHSFTLDNKPLVVNPLKIEFWGTPTKGEAPLSVTYFGKITEGEAPYYWELITSCGTGIFGYSSEFWRSDICKNTGQTLPHTATLIVLDNEGTKKSKSIQIEVEPKLGVQPLDVSLKTSSTTALPTDSITFSGTITGGVPEYEISLTFGDGSKVTAIGDNFTKTHTYTTIGNYTAKMLVQDDFGFVKRDSVDITITNQTVTQPQPNVSGPLSTDKKTYSVGEDVIVNVDLSTTASNQLVAISIINSNNDNIFTKTQTLDISGDASLKFRIGQNLPSGTHQIILTGLINGNPLHHLLSFTVS